MLAGGAGSQGLAWFQREMLATSKMQHPNIVTLFTTGADNGRPFIVMEYLKGSNLRERMIKIPTAWGGDEVARIGHETCAALEYAHAEGVIHRDIKPENLFMCDAGMVKVTDFGVAKALSASQVTVSGSVVGTPGYMAPEQWLGEPAAGAVDIWATGCTLYELLAGTRPRGDLTPIEHVAAAARGERVPGLRGAAAGVPSWLADAVMAMLEPDPARRPTAVQCRQLLSGPQPDSRYAATASVPPPAWQSAARPPSRSLPAGQRPVRQARPVTAPAGVAGIKTQPGVSPGMPAPAPLPVPRSDRVSRSHRPSPAVRALSRVFWLLGAVASFFLSGIVLQKLGGPYPWTSGWVFPIGICDVIAIVYCLRMTFRSSGKRR
jgi:serine/threonine protein kinase